MTATDGLVGAVLRVAAGGRSAVTGQQQVLSELLEHGARTAPVDVLAALEARQGVGTVAAVEQIRARLAAFDATVTVPGAVDYPAQLEDAWPELGAPLWLFVAGARPPVRRRPAVAVVGTRAPTADGRRTAHDLAAALAEAGALVVSGLARGIDQAAHRGALAATGDTVAVLGTGLGVDYPARSQRLRAQIVASGALLTELPPGAPPRPWQFLERNRIISGLADATVVVEGRARSGALQTARLAASQGRDVWAVPGSINSPTSAAPLALLRDGAIPLTGIDEFVASVVDDRRDPPTLFDERDDDVPDRSTRGLSPAAGQVFELLGAVPASTDDLVVAGTLPAQQVLIAVGELVDHGVAVVTPRGVVRT